jgi:hypothetical protein
MITRARAVPDTAIDNVGNIAYVQDCRAAGKLAGMQQSRPELLQRDQHRGGGGAPRIRRTDAICRRCPAATTASVITTTTTTTIAREPVLARPQLCGAPAHLLHRNLQTKNRHVGWLGRTSRDGARRGQRPPRRAVTRGAGSCKRREADRRTECDGGVGTAAATDAKGPRSVPAWPRWPRPSPRSSSAALMAAAAAAAAAAPPCSSAAQLAAMARAARTQIPQHPPSSPPYISSMPPPRA